LGILQLHNRLINSETSFVSLFISIKDTGIGIPKNKQNKIWKSFTQVDNSDTRKYGGSGLGLAISQKIVGLMGGCIQVNSSPGNGSTFSFTIKLKKKLSIETPVINSVSNIHGKLKVLIVEDIEVNRKVLDIMLKEAGYTTLFAENGKKALKVIQENEKIIDLILLDIRLPDMSGYEVTKKLIIKGIKIPIIAQTANVLKEDRQKCFSCGMAGYISKPITFQSLKAEIDRIF
jgi:CheY-like chemotaxis protein